MRPALLSEGTSRRVFGLATVATLISFQAKASGSATVTTVGELVAATADPALSVVEVQGVLKGAQTLRLLPGMSLVGRQGAAIEFHPGLDGVCLWSDNTVASLRLVTSPTNRALFNNADASSLGETRLMALRVQGQVQLIARGAVRGGQIEARDLHVEAADTRSRPDRPSGFGVEVLQGAFTLWNQQADPDVCIRADLSGLSAGRSGAPIFGGGILVAGTLGGGTVEASRIETGAVHSDGGIAPGTADRITAGVFVLHGTRADTVRNLDVVATYGVNDMVLNNWGDVEHWVAQGTVTSSGASGTAVVNFGTIAHLDVQGLILTSGTGARGFNVFAGTVALAEFHRIVTRGDGAVGIQIGQHVGRMLVRAGIETFGGTGPSLIKGQVVRLSAIPLRVTPDGSVQEVMVGGGLIAHGPGIPPLEIVGLVERLAVSGSLKAGLQ